MPRRDRFDDDDEDFDDRPGRSRSRSRRDDYDDAESKPGLATAAAVLWLISAGLLLLAFILRAIMLIGGLAADVDVNPVCGGVDLLLVLGTGLWAGIAGLMTILGKARSLTAFGVLSLILPPAMVLMESAIAFFVGIEIARDMNGARGDLPLILAFRSFLFNSILVAGVLLAGIFALSANRRYRAWHSRRDR